MVSEITRDVEAKTSTLAPKLDLDVSQNLDDIPSFIFDTIDFDWNHIAPSTKKSDEGIQNSNPSIHIPRIPSVHIPIMEFE